MIKRQCSVSKDAYLRKKLHHSPDRSPWSHQRAINSSWTARTCECSDWTPPPPGHSPTDGKIMDKSQREKDHLQKTKKHLDLKIQKKSALLAGTWCLDQRQWVLLDCTQTGQCIPYSGPWCRGSASLCTFQSSLSPVRSTSASISLDHRSHAPVHRYTQQMDQVGHKKTSSLQQSQRWRSIAGPVGCRWVHSSLGWG